MDNRLIFRYHRERAKAEMVLLRGCRTFRGPEKPTHTKEASEAGTQKGKSTRAMVDPG